ncbi:hypothetical protein OEA41_007253 [Lepraria neglecta]|uniref:Uncharacterized protein n=1 Tax=Lepraria neglecta TaxID=209136 RepID=A0AAE0DMS8_9LECA|nr:hypothetical protein OEA41_007253 [Lepraria neglecta]
MVPAVHKVGPASPMGSAIYRTKATMDVIHVPTKRGSRAAARRFVLTVRSGYSAQAYEERDADCIVDKTAAGDEAILQCSSGSYCCDTNRPTTGCCDTSTSRFSLAALPILAGGGTAVGSMGSSPTPSPSASASSSSTSASDTSTFASTSRKTSSSSEAAAKVSSTPTISVLTQIVTENGSQSTLVTSTSANVAVPASSTGSPAASSSSSKSLGSVIGPAVGVPVAVLALMALAFFLFWRRRRSRKAHPPPRNMQSNSEEPTPMYGEMKPPVESSPYTGKSELEGSPQVGHPSPNPSTAPPSYRGVAGRPMSELQGSPTAATFRDSRSSELAASTYTGPSTSPRQPDLPAVGEEDQGPAELPGSTDRSYRPPGS